MSKLPTEPGDGWRWARPVHEIGCAKCGEPITTQMNVIVKLVVVSAAEEPVEIPLHPMCAAAVSARRFLDPTKPSND